MLLVIWTVVSLVTLLIELVPGDPATVDPGRDGDAGTDRKLQRKTRPRPARILLLIRRRNGLCLERADNRYADYWTACFRAILARRSAPIGPCWDMILERYPATIKLAIAAMLVAIGIALPLGVLAGSRKNSLVDNFASFFALLGISLPTFVIGPFLVYIFAVKLGWFSPTGESLSRGHHPARRHARSRALGDPDAHGPLERDRRTRRRLRPHRPGKRLERTKGRLQTRLKNGLIPVVTILGLQLGVLLAGAIITEKIFNWQGLGLLLLEDGIGKRDYRLVQGCVLVISVTYIFANSLTDFVYRRLDPTNSDFLSYAMNRLAYIGIAIAAHRLSWRRSLRR